MFLVITTLNVTMQIQSQMSNYSFYGSNWLNNFFKTITESELYKYIKPIYFVVHLRTEFERSISIYLFL